jgi:hypothetical protein
MREVTQAEAERWTALAQEHGFANEDGDVLPGRFVVEDMEGDTMTLRLITPIIADHYTENLEEKMPPIMFDRNAAGEIILPGRWWADMFERVSDRVELTDHEATTAISLERNAKYADIRLPADTDTIAFTAAGPDGNPVTYEALPPEGRIQVGLERG